MAAELGWGDAAWAEAGGFEAVLLGQLPLGALATGAAGPVFLIAIEDLDIEFNLLNQNTIVQNTAIVFDAANGGSIDVGGDLNALAGQQAQISGGIDFSG
jgi:hypothetical protein